MRSIDAMRATPHDNRIKPKGTKQMDEKLRLLINASRTQTQMPIFTFANGKEWDAEFDAQGTDEPFIIHGEPNILIGL